MAIPFKSNIELDNNIIVNNDATVNNNLIVKKNVTISGRISEFNVNKIPRLEKGLKTLANLLWTKTLQQCNWEEIDAISASGLASGCFNIGDKKTIQIGSDSYEVRIIDFNRDILEDGHSAGITFEMVDCLKQRYAFDEQQYPVYGWSQSTLRTALNNDVYSTIESSLKNVIKSTKKITYTAVGPTYSEQTSYDKIFLLNIRDIYTKTFSYEYDPYKFYKDKNLTHSSSVANTDLIKRVNGEANEWLTSSYEYEANKRATGKETITVLATGRPDTIKPAVITGVSFCFCV